jgi:predicted metal-binding protein
VIFKKLRSFRRDDLRLHPKNQGNISKGQRSKQVSGDITGMAIDMGATDAKLISPSQVVVSNWVRLRCQFGCPNFSKRLTCPPFTPPIDEIKDMLSEYKKILLLKFEQPPISRETGTGDDFVKELNKRENLVNDRTLKIERELMLMGYYKVFALEPGMCNRCTECVVQPGKCRHPTEARPAPESFAIDVFQTVRNAGWRIEVKTDQFQSWAHYDLILIE